ncbi:hypothetical protein [Belliella pelovolcani]|uniref:Uncharacterized protein n=1 Tax=Belliella pelovolcani TaxID=529505 RepID=A0A1N7PUF5_9BACT|nr:hypothetical protein [Belliella pelovolcani]SIT14192.1 hypothetical protein SAMN05421761_1214 [Belliella pelovolcani]
MGANRKDFTVVYFACFVAGGGIISNFFEDIEAIAEAKFLLV